MSDSCRTLLVQPTLAKYRVPVYRELAAREGIDFRLWYGDHDVLQNAEPDGFHAELKPLKAWRFGGQELLWHGAQVEAARSDIDVLMLGWGSRYLSQGPALRQAKRRGLPVVLWGHGYSKNETPFRRFLRDRLAKYATALMFYDRLTADAAVASGWPAEKVFVAPNAIDQAPIAAARKACLENQASLRSFQEENQLEGRRVLLYVSRFSPENRLDLLVEAIESLRSRMPEVLAVLVGGGAEFDRIQQMVREKNLESHLRLLGPIYEEEKLAPWFVSSEAYVYPSAIGLSLLHAFGYGLPVVTDDGQGSHNPEIVAYNPDPESPGANGLSYSAGQSQSLADTLERLLGDHDLRGKLANGALETIERQYNVPAMVDGMAAAIRYCHEHR